LVRLGTTVLSVILMSSGLCAQPHNQLSEEERKAGWRLLFDGRTFNGWDDPARKSPPGHSWTIEDGCLKSVPAPRILEDLRTTQEFGDFELMFDWRVQPGGNSGIKYRIWNSVFLLFTEGTRGGAKVSERAKLGPEQTGQQYEVAMEFQLIDDDRHADAKEGPERTTGALYFFAPPLKRNAKPAGEWNRSRLLVQGMNVEHWVNDVRVLTADLKSPQIVDKVMKRWGRFPEVVNDFHRNIARPSPIALQNHDDSVVWFRNLKVRQTSKPRP
jgi:hypothetical protein